ncbi:MAG: ImmA/IrrE family metallo-endopeptidase, partial [Firmicutes bacterium]|nr:ImmA/IrrE family metallo-endopeptidase [Bacillota bacterium]
LGHFEIKGHNEREYFCTYKDINVFKPEKIYEYEANQFAAELLMPERKIQEIMKRNPFNMETIELISNSFATSITSAALRAVKLTPDSCAIVVSSDNRVLWSQKSRNFRYTLKTKGQTLSPNTCAADFFIGKDVPDQSEIVSPYGWISDPGLPNDFTLLEHSIYFPNLNMVLSLITLPEKDDYDLDIDEFDNE